ncbi:MAG: hypothetical protein H6662_04890 [Ardenticatenaceae bacterium]|nr:hypothetical protein [Anaerolineales bacterium]MCB8920902.1 hypothetical protein [Ardenticatenaceae bacterium]
MNRKESVKNWVVIFVVLIVTSILAASWPLITSAFSRGQGGSTAVRPEISTITLPFPLFGLEEINSLLAVGLLAVVVIVLVAGVGGVLGAINLFLNKQTEVVKESETYQAHLSTLAQRETERMKELRADRKAGPVPAHTLPRWSVVSTSLIVLLFTVAGAMILNKAFVPDGAELTMGSFAFSTSVAIVGGFVLLALIFLAFWIRPQRLEAIEATDYGPIPWDTIWIILSGLIVVGLGVGLVIYFNIPG